MTTEPEEWRPCPGWETTYEVSSLGRVRSRGYRILRARCAGPGYLLVVLCAAPRPQTSITIHRLVAMAFLGPPPAAEKNCVNHKDGNKLNNSPSNLEWCTLAENNQHAREVLGRNASRITPTLLEELRRLGAAGLSYREIAERTSLSTSHICRLLRAQGPRSPGRKRRLSAGDVAEIRRLGAAGVSQPELAARFGCVDSYISMILSGRARKSG